jgi:sugar/nucleoside kinase (ribokinase family)
MKISKSSNRKVALALSDTFCVERHREDWLGLLEEFVDFIFCNEKEICSLYRTENLNEAIEKVSNDIDAAFITLGSKGSLVIEGSNKIEIKAVSVQDVVDSTGAGDIFASGVIFGMSRKLSFTDCAELGSLMASEVITNLGSRIEKDPKKLIEHLL